MFAFEKEIAKREMLTPVLSYPYQVVAVSDQAKLNFGLSVKKRGPIERLKDLFKRSEELNEFPFVGQMTFFYDDPNESEKKRIEETKELAQFHMARNGIKGINYTGNGFSFRSLNPALQEGEDYKIVVGEKIIHEQPLKLTFDDVLAL